MHKVGADLWSSQLSTWRSSNLGTASALDMVLWLSYPAEHYTE